MARRLAPLPFALGLALLSACSSSSSGGGGSGGDGGDGTSTGVGVGSTGSGSTGSGTPQGEAIDCTWFEDPGNCWATTVAAATACVPPGVITDDPSIPNHVGVFAADRLSCAYAEGPSVEFATPVPDPNSSEMLPFADYVWDFVVKDAGGSPCVSFAVEEEPFTVHLASGDFSMGLVGPSSNFEYQIQCPDGSQYHIPYETLSGCWTGFDNGPTSGYLSAGSFVTYELFGGGFEEQQLFLCQ